MISVVVLTFNEAANLPRCLASVRWSDDVLVVDSGSTDGTVEVARDLGARVLARPFDTFAAQRNFAMEHGGLLNRWVLQLDADETVDEALRLEMTGIACDPSGSKRVYRVPSRMIFMGRWLRHAGMYPAYQVRFGRTESLRFVDHGHGQREACEPQDVGTLTAALDHYNFSKGVNDWFSRHLRYAAQEAALAEVERGSPVDSYALIGVDPTRRRRALKKLAFRLPWQPALRFLYVYLLRCGFLDGRAGFHYAVQMGMFQYLIDRNRVELRTRA